MTQLKIKKNTIIRRGCMRCGGDLFLDQLEARTPRDDDEYVCLQCGRRVQRARDDMLVPAACIG